MLSFRPLPIRCTTYGVDRSGAAGGTGTSTTVLLADGSQPLTDDWDTGLFGIDVGGNFKLSGIISPAAISTPTHNWAPTGFADASLIRLNAAATSTITGLAGGTAGRMVFIHNVSGFEITFEAESVSSTAANRFAVTNDITIQDNEVALVQYDGTESRWRLVTSSSGSGGAVESTNVVVRNYTGDDVTTTFALGATPTGETVVFVFQDGVFQNNTEWTLSGSDLTFSTAPATGVLIETRTCDVLSIGTPSDNTVTTAKIVNAAVTPAKLDRSYLELAGGTMTGDLTIDKSSPAIYLERANDSEVVAIYYREADGSNRWATYLGASGGSNNFVIGRYNSAGSYLDNAISIANTTGSVTFSKGIGANGADPDSYSYTSIAGVGSTNQHGVFGVSGTDGYAGIVGTTGYNSGTGLQGPASVSSGFTGDVIRAQCTQAGAGGSTLIAGYSSAGSDREFYVSDQGNGACDGSWTGGGADYAEYFEWADGNPDAEDRVGRTVVLDGEKIRLSDVSDSADDIIGVVSGFPGFVGNDRIKWDGRYLRDEFGRYVLNDDGTRKDNPDYDPARPYIERSKRPEWAAIGLVGQLYVRYGQPIGRRWIRMKQGVACSPNLYLVR